MMTTRPEELLAMLCHVTTALALGTNGASALQHAAMREQRRERTPTIRREIVLMRRIWCPPFRVGGATTHALLIAKAPGRSGRTAMSPAVRARLSAGSQSPKRRSTEALLARLTTARSSTSPVNSTLATVTVKARGRPGQRALQPVATDFQNGRSLSRLWLLQAVMSAMLRMDLSNI